MQVILETLHSIFNSEKCIQIESSTISILEPGRQASLKKVDIVSVGQNALAIKFDQCGFPGQKTFVSSHEMHRACDAIAFCCVNGNPFILCIELKSSEPNRDDVSRQFRSAHCLLDYIDSLLRTYHESTIENWPRRYFLFHNQGRVPLTKSPLFESQSLVNDTPEKAHLWPVQNGERIYLRQLLKLTV